MLPVKVTARCSLSARRIRPYSVSQVPPTTQRIAAPLVSRRVVVLRDPGAKRAAFARLLAQERRIPAPLGKMSSPLVVTSRFRHRRLIVCGHPDSFARLSWPLPRLPLPRLRTLTENKPNSTASTAAQARAGPLIRSTPIGDRRVPALSTVASSPTATRATPR